MRVRTLKKNVLKVVLFNKIKQIDCVFVLVLWKFLSLGFLVPCLHVIFIFLFFHA